MGSYGQLQQMHEFEAFARGNELLLFAPQANESWLFATFDGTGQAAKLTIAPLQAPLTVQRLAVNGKIVCGPCKAGTEYGAWADSRLEITVETGAAAQENGTQAVSKPLFPTLFDDSHTTYTDVPLRISLAGGWRAQDNARLPSSFYGIDSPFHIRKIAELARCIPNMDCNEFGYPTASSLPAAAISLFFGFTPEYSYKIFAIFLSLAPIAAFYLFTRKLSGARDAAFLFSSLAYLFIPTRGMLNGGPCAGDLAVPLFHLFCL
jgi:hypothetical protein